MFAAVGFRPACIAFCFLYFLEAGFFLHVNNRITLTLKVHAGCLYGLELPISSSVFELLLRPEFLVLIFALLVQNLFLSLFLNENALVWPKQTSSKMLVIPDLPHFGVSRWYPHLSQKLLLVLNDHHLFWSDIVLLPGPVIESLVIAVLVQVVEHI